MTGQRQHAELIMCGILCVHVRMRACRQCMWELNNLLSDLGSRVRSVDVNREHACKWHVNVGMQEQRQTQAEHEAEVNELWKRIDEGNERLGVVKRDMQLARQDMDNAREDMQLAQTDLDAYIARRPDSAVDRRW